MAAKLWLVPTLYVVLQAGIASAQPFARPPTATLGLPSYGGGGPAVSPYLNLVRGGRANSPAIDYFGIVRPQQDFRQQILGLQQQVSIVELATGQAQQQAYATGFTTGTTPRFLNTGRYFLNLQGGTTLSTPFTRPSIQSTAQVETRPGIIVPPVSGGKR